MTHFAPYMSHRAVSMRLAAYLDGRYVEMHIVTETGEKLTIACGSDSIFALQRQIEKFGQACPEINTWTRAKPATPIPSAVLPVGAPAVMH